MLSPVLAGVLLFLLLISEGIARTPYSPHISEPLNERWRWRHIEVLSGKGVRCMIDDKHGHMWFGLDRGLMRFDGYKWEHFDDAPFLQQPVTTLFKTRDGKIVAGGEAGLLIFDGTQWNRVFPIATDVSLGVSAISETPDGTILAGTQDGIIILRNGKVSMLTVMGKEQPLRAAHGDIQLHFLPDEILFNHNFGRVDDIFVHRDGLIWLFMSRANTGRLLQFYLRDTTDPFSGATL